MEQSTEGLGLGYTPIGPTWELGNYFLGADNQGRDVMARLLYGGLNSLLIAGAATDLSRCSSRPSSGLSPASSAGSSMSCCRASSTSSGRFRSISSPSRCRSC